MRLRRIRLAGFKSFVDPTTIEFPGSIVGVVGPNGGGKSNIIDAVRWVMGEVSARSLRGGTMADVVFNGSNSRKPVSQAAVELVFDNLDGRAGGRFAAYSEIAVRREVGREGQSTYRLNGTRCRRRDVMDVFHGTGLGPRSYAIIEQGMISRVIEAKPDELRDFLEEAAGISQYKERRRETGNRMRHTLENLERLNDLREELGRRLAHLKRQATLAEKYRELKAGQREIEAEHLALRWRALDEEAGRHARRVAEQQGRLDAALAGQRRVEAALEKARAACTGATDTFNRRYRDVLEAEAEVARAEESIRSIRRRKEEVAEALRHETERLEAARLQVESEREQREALAARLEADEPALAALHGQAEGAHREYLDVEEEARALQAEFEALSEREREPARAAHAEQARIQHLESAVEELEARARALETERGAIDAGSLEREAAPVRLRVEALEGALETAEVEQSRALETVRGLREEVQAATKALHDARETLGQLRGRAASLEALQQEGLGAGPDAVAEWLEAGGFADAPRLAQEMRVAPGWEHAVEAVLGARLQAVRTGEFETVAAHAATLEQGTFTALDAGAPEPAATGGAHGLAALRSKVETRWPAAGLLEGVLCAESLDEGLAVRSRLAPGESVITAGGVWIGPAWLHVRRGGVEGYGVIERERALESLGREIERTAAHEQSCEGAALDLSGKLRTAEEAYVAAQHDHNENHRRCAALRSELAARTAEADQAAQRLDRLGAELADTASRVEAERGKLASARERFEHSSGELSRLTGERERCEERRRERREALEAAHGRWQGARDDAYELGLRIEGMRSRLKASEEARERDLHRLEELEGRRRTLGDSLDEIEAPLAQALEALDGKLARRASLDAVMREARAEVERLEEAVRHSDEERLRHTTQAQEERGTLERLRVEGQETLVRRKTAEEGLAASGHTLEALLERVGPEAGADEWAGKLEAMERRIARLGPINLAAIEEHEQQAERKGYLDAQHADLEEALATLEAAIRKIDRETRIRFRETWEKVNEGLGTTFPRLFGGGSAELQLTSEDLLEAGVTVMARPPGKRNTSIHQLSGGEKALTAIALVFAIFELNPAPFCLLDEVDAPLDDPNVGRFCELVREMANRVQLVLVTHNKITMEVTQQLIGVTMNEPGVSRLVAVDVEEAAEMAEAS